MRSKIVSTVLAALLCSVLGLPAIAADNAKPPESVLQALATSITTWFGEIAAEVEAALGGVPEEATTAGANDVGQAELGPIIFPGG